MNGKSIHPRWKHDVLMFYHLDELLIGRIIPPKTGERRSTELLAYRGARGLSRMQPTLPRIIRLLLFALVSFFALFIGLLLLFLLPSFIYIALYHQDRFFPYLGSIAHLSVTSPNFPLELLGMLGLGTWMAVARYRRQRMYWRIYQERITQGAEPLPVLLENPVALPPPTQPPLLHAEVNQRRSLRGFVLREAICVWLSLLGYFAWSQSFFRWPPNIVFDHTVVGTVLFCFLLGSVIQVWQQRPQSVIANQTGIIYNGQLIAWSELHQLLLDPFISLSNVPIAAENYLLFTSAKPIELSAPNGASQSAQQQAVRSLVAFAMQQTRLPLQVDRKALRQRDELLGKQSQQRDTVGKYIGYAVIGVVLLMGIILASHYSHLNPTYHTVTGQLASYSRNHNGATIRLSGDATEYSLPSLGVWPSPPQALPMGASVTMLAAGKDIGVLDVRDASAHWHITTQGYAEPWMGWIEFSGISSIFLFLALALLAQSVSYFWQRQRGIPSATLLPLYPAPAQGDAPQVSATIAQDLRR